VKKTSFCSHVCNAILFCSLAGLAVPNAAYAAGDDHEISPSNEPRRCSQGTQLSFWEDDKGNLWADLTEKLGGFSKTYEGLVVVADPDIPLDLDELNQLSETDQKRFVHVTLRKNLSEKNLLALENRFPEVEITGVVHLGQEGLKGGVGCLRCRAWDCGHGQEYLTNGYCAKCKKIDDNYEAYFKEAHPFYTSTDGYDPLINPKHIVGWDGNKAIYASIRHSQQDRIKALQTKQWSLKLMNEMNEVLEKQFDLQIKELDQASQGFKKAYHLPESVADKPSSCTIF